MYISPDTSIILYKNVPLDPTYHDTMYFANKVAQANFFNGYTHTAAMVQYYQRENRNYMRIHKPIEDVEGYNYLSFTNVRFENKTYYAFIIEYNYINNETTEVVYQIDYLQTYYFDYTVPQAFIERESPAYDDVGDNLLPENVETGEFVCDNVTSSGKFSNYKIVAVASYDIDGEDATGGYVGGVYTGLCYTIFNNATAFNAWLEAYPTKTKGIVAIFMIPSALITEMSTSADDRPESVTITLTKPTSLGTYTPRNKKLLTNQFNFLYATTYNGSYNEYPYEYFAYDTIKFGISMATVGVPTAICFPFEYKGEFSSGSGSGNFDEALTLNGFPQCAYTTDTYKAWLAQNAVPLATSMSADLAQLIGGMASGNAVMAGQAGIGIVNSIAQTAIASRQPRTVGGTQKGDILVGIRQLDFHFMQKHITPQFARIIDSFFDRFGYAVKETKQIYRNNRALWTYVKTIDCKVRGDLPASASTEIQKIYDNGVTFWKSGANIGNYSLASQNTPLEGGATV